MISLVFQHFAAKYLILGGSVHMAALTMTIIMLDALIQMHITQSLETVELITGQVIQSALLKFVREEILEVVAVHHLQ